VPERVSVEADGAVRGASEETDAPGLEESNICERRRFF